jgi:hypothetical protein
MYLSVEGMRELRREIRIEQKERSEVARAWLTSLTGLGGVIVAILALLFGHH